METHIGTSGWSYAHWDDVLYHGVSPARRLGVYVDAFDTVELNASFYRWPKSTTFASWNHRLPPGFVMTVKAPRGLTHAKRLYAPERWIDRIAAGLHELGSHRGCLLVQLAPSHQRDDARLEHFLRLVPEWIRIAVEFRHGSWLEDRVFDILAAHRAAYCVMSGAALPCVLRTTATTAYVRFHGPDHHTLYAGSYSDQDLEWWRERLGEWRRDGHEVYAYFNNDGDGNAVRNARVLRSMVTS